MGFQLELLTRAHRRKKFSSGDKRVDDWLIHRALGATEKNASTTRVLVSGADVAGFYTLANTSLDVSLIPAELLGGRDPRHPVPTVTLAWLGVDERFRGRGLGTLLFARALADSARAWSVVRFVAVVVDALTAENFDFYQRSGFTPLPGTTHKLYLPARTLQAMLKE